MKNDGGAAFPRPASEFTKNGSCPDGNDPIEAEAGMSLRDWFAGQALVGASSIEGPTYKFSAGEPLDAWRVRMAKQEAAYCYRMADAMLEARKAVSNG